MGQHISVLCLAEIPSRFSKPDLEGRSMDSAGTKNPGLTGTNHFTWPVSNNVAVQMDFRQTEELF